VEEKSEALTSEPAAPRVSDVLFGVRPGKEAPEYLHDDVAETRLKRLRDLRDLTIRTRFSVLAVLILLAFAAALASWNLRRFGGDVVVNIAAFGTLFALLIPVGLYQFSVRHLDEEIRKLEIKIDTPESDWDEQRAYQLFKRHESELRKYYDHTLSQSRLLAGIGVGCIGAGLLVLALAGWAIRRSGDSGNEVTTWAVAILGAAGSFLSSYVAVVFLKMYATTAQALNDFHNRLVSTHHLHLANFFVAKIVDPLRREESLKAIVTEIAKH